MGASNGMPLVKKMYTNDQGLPEPDTEPRDAALSCALWPLMLTTLWFVTAQPA